MMLLHALVPLLVGAESCSGGCECVAELAVCVPTAPSKDLGIFEKSLRSISKHVVEAKEIYVVSVKDAGIQAALERVGGNWLDEDEVFPFNYSWVRSALDAKTQSTKYVYHVGWYLQQLIKLYCGRAIGGRDVLVVDSDVVFFRDVAFVERTVKTEKGCNATYRYAFSRESHGAYEKTNLALLGPTFGALAKSKLEEPTGAISGVVHHMIFRHDIIQDIEAKIYARHQMPLYAALFQRGSNDTVMEHPRSNAFSEYQLYFHFARSFHPDSVHVRQLYWGNGPSPVAVVQCGGDRWPIDTMRRARYDGEALDIDQKAGYDFIAYHSYAKRRPCVYAPHGQDGLCFGSGCTFSCLKRRDGANYRPLNRSIAAPRLCPPTGAVVNAAVGGRPPVR